MAKPSVSIQKLKGTLGGSVPSQDGVALLLITAPEAYSFSGSGIVRSLDEAEEAGFTEAKDLLNNCLVWEHIKDFYSIVGTGSELHIILLGADLTLGELFTPGSDGYVILQNYLAAQQGNIKLLGVALNPSYAESHVTSISVDLLAAIPLADAFADVEFAQQRPIEVFLEGRKFTGTPSSAVDLSTLDSGEVSVIVSRDAGRNAALMAGGNTGAGNHAQLGLLLGAVAAVHVGRNIGRHLNGSLPIITAEFSGGQVPYEDFSETQISTLYDKGYIFYDRYNGLDGWYFINDRTCTRSIDTDGRIRLNRTINKACRIILQEYMLRLKDEAPVDAETGLLKGVVLAGFETALQDALRLEMWENPDRSRPQEVSGGTVRIDPTQNVLATNELVAEVVIVPLANFEKLTAKVKLVNPVT